MGIYDTAQLSEDDSRLFRKCWSLGEAFYYLERYFPCFFEDSSSNCNDLKINSKVIRLYSSQLVALNSICNEIGINDDAITEFTEEIRINLDKISNSGSKLGKDNFKDINFEIELESYLIGNLIGKDPRYDHIFRIAKHSMELYREDDLKRDNSDCKGDKDQQKDQEKYHNLRSDLENIKNFVARDKITLIHIIIDKWPDLVGNYCKYKKSNEWKNRPDFNKIKQPELIEIVNRIRGLITGTLQVDDLLKRQDRIIWAILSYFFIILAFLGIGISLCLILKFDPIIYVNNLDLNDFVVNVPLLTLVVGIIAGFIKSARPVWQKWSDWITLKLAIWRIKNPEKPNIFLPFWPRLKNIFSSKRKSYFRKTEIR